MKELTKEELLHKYILHGDEEAAVSLIKSDQKTDFNVQIIYALCDAQFLIAEALINHPMFNYEEMDGFGEPILCSLIYYYIVMKKAPSEDLISARIADLIRTIIDNHKGSLNVLDINLESPLSIACQEKHASWIVKKILENDDIDINTIDDCDYSALTNAILYDNIEAIEMLAKRSDLKVRKDDIEIALNHDIDLKAHGINCKEFIMAKA